MKKVILLAIAILIAAGLLVVDVVDIFKNKNQDALQASNELPADFQDFYQRFHRDEDFQLSRIDFPLEGLPPDVDEGTLVSGDFTWKKDEWVMHKPLGTFGSDFKQRFVELEDGLIVEVIRQADSKFAIERRWARQDGEWRLVYYAGMNLME